MKNKRHIAILGSTGSIGTQALEVISDHKDVLCVEVLTANSNWQLLAEQALKFEPNCVVIANKEFYSPLKVALEHTDVKVFAGKETICDVVTMQSVDIVLASMVGFSGLEPVLSAVKSGKAIALSNKETLVVGGELVINEAIRHNVPILPVDSEHSAIFQCLIGEENNPPKTVYLTASGGPFYGYNIEQLEKVSLKQALNHPNWSMGKKVTIDSATLMNKGLEMIEAHWLFGVEANNIKVAVHRQSIIHSLVEFADGSIKAQLGLPDMRLPIQYALTFPERLKNNFETLDLFSLNSLTFEKPDTKTFACLELAYKAMEQGGNIPAIMNAANEMAVAAFLNEKISFNDIPKIIEDAMMKHHYIASPNYDDLLQTDEEVRKSLQHIISF
ncbi:MAG: 1-deoxy-D-xylulose-5-phosphate reductoisomerase [Bacteroidales bacterium]|jgi:1-deoxy-D-xylulose-5-phosphate reductoisomerase|nr:1-deoxy-D-xylulose-5-phosphate reductoisomerase [Bacteroidales bacterium]